MSKFGNASGGLVRTDQGGELARSTQFINMLEKDFHYTVEPTGADSPSQNGAAEIYNDKQGVRVRRLLYSSGLPAKFWSAALLHTTYLHNRLVHSVTKMTPYEAWHGRSRIFHTSKSSGLECAFVDLDNDGANSTDTTTQAYSLATPPLTKISYTWI